MTPREELIAVVKAYQEASERVNRNHGKILIKNEVTKVKPMTMPKGLLFYLESWSK